MIKWRDKLFEADPTPAPKPEKLPTTLPGIPATTTHLPSYTVEKYTPPSGAPNDLYNKLRDKTDFDQTDAGRSLKKYLDPLAGLSLDEHSKMKAAAAQAKAQDGLTSEKILATFDTLKQTLHAEQVHFQDTVKTATAREIADRQTKIDNYKKQIDDANQMVIQLTTELAQARGRLDHVTSDFSSAFATRCEELDQQYKHIAGLLE